MKGLLRFGAPLMMLLWVGSALAGSNSAPPGGDTGSSGPEPEVWALILFTLVPGLFFVRRALAGRAPEQA